MKKTNIIKTINTVIMCIAYILLFTALYFSWKSGVLRYLAKGPNIIQTVSSPDLQYAAYVDEKPSLDPPNQELYIERSDKSHFLGIAKLTGDVDSIIETLWSPDSQIVVFHSKCYLTAVRISDWKIIRIYLGKEWKRHEPQHGSPFSGAGPIKKVSLIDFPESNCFTYRFEDDATLYTVTFG